MKIKSQAGVVVRRKGLVLLTFLFLSEVNAQLNGRREGVTSMLRGDVSKLGPRTGGVVDTKDDIGDRKEILEERRRLNQNKNKFGMFDAVVMDKHDDERTESGLPLQENTFLNVGYYLPNGGTYNTGIGSAYIQDVGSVTIGSNDPNTGRRYIVCFKQSVNDVATLTDKIAKEYGFQPKRTFSTAIRGFSVDLTNDEYKIFRSRMGQFESSIDSIEVDHKVFALEAEQDQSPPLGIQRIGGDAPSIRQHMGNEKVVVAVLDTGCDTDHPDLSNIQKCMSFVSDENTCEDFNGHGTHVAGIVGGTKTGVAPGAAIWAMKVLGQDGSGNISNSIEALEEILRNKENVHIINMSLGAFQFPSKCDDNCNCGSALHSALCNCVHEGILVVVAAGNSNENARRLGPANYGEAITVSAMGDTDGKSGGTGPRTAFGTEDDSFAPFSNYGAYVDICAPGVSIESTYLAGGYKKLSGTSMASPHVAGAAALSVARHGLHRSRAGVYSTRDRLLSTSSPQDSSFGFRGDPDLYPETILNVAGIGLKPSPLFVELSFDKEDNTYSLNEVPFIIVTIRDANGNTVTGLQQNIVGSLVRGDKDISNSFPISFREVTASPGNYETAIVTPRDDKKGQYKVMVHVATDGKTGQASGVFQVTPTIQVSHINFSRGTNEDGNLEIAVTCSRNGASKVTLLLFKDGGFIGQTSGFTTDEGLVVFTLPRAEPGRYKAVVDPIENSEFTFRYRDIDEKFDFI